MNSGLITVLECPDFVMSPKNFSFGSFGLVSVLMIGLILLVVNGKDPGFARGSTLSGSSNKTLEGVTSRLMFSSIVSLLFGGSHVNKVVGIY